MADNFFKKNQIFSIKQIFIYKTNSMKKIEKERTEYVCQMLVENSGTTGIIKYTAPEEEDYKISDAWIISTSTTEYPLETKSILGGWGFKEDGEWRTYFTKDIYNKLHFETDIATGTPVYFVNAETEYRQEEGSKWDKLMKDNKSCLSFLAKDGIVLFSHKSMVDAFIGYAYYLTSHTTEIGNKGKRTREKKAVLDMTKGLFIPCDTPDKLLIKK